MGPLFLPRILHSFEDRLQALVSFEGRRVKRRPAMTAGFRTGDLAEFLGNLEIFGDGLAFLLDLFLLVNQHPLELPEFLLRFPDLGRQGGKIIIHGLGDVLQVVELAELVGNTGQGLGDGWHKGPLLVGHHRKDRNLNLFDLGNERNQVFCTSAEHFLAKEGLSGENVDNQIQYRIPFAELDPVDHWQDGPLFAESLLELAVLESHLALDQAEVVAELILDRHRADGNRGRTFLESLVDPREAEVISHSHGADRQDDFQPDFTPWQSQGRFLDRAIAEVGGRTMRIRALLIS